MTRNVCITAVDGQTGFLIAELLLRDAKFSKKIDSVTGLAMDPSGPRARELEELGATVVAHQPSRLRTVVSTLKKVGCDTICLVPPAHADRFEISLEMADAARRAGVQNVLLISSAGCDYADPKMQPRLRKFIDIEAAVLANKGDPDAPLGHSACVIRAGFYAENLLLYSEQAKAEGVLPLPIGPNHKFAPVALGVNLLSTAEAPVAAPVLTLAKDIAHMAAHVLSGKGEHGFDDRHRGQMMVATGELPLTPFVRVLLTRMAAAAIGRGTPGA